MIVKEETAERLRAGGSGEKGYVNVSTIKVLMCVSEHETGKVFSIQDTTGRCMYEVPFDTVAEMVDDERKGNR